MILLKLDQITGEEILARPIMTEDYKELLSEGTKIRLEYLPKLNDLGIKEVYVKEVYVKDDIIKSESILILKEEVNNKCKDKVREIISRHTYRKSQNMMEICTTADIIISNILQEEKIVEQIYDIKERNADIYEHSISTCTLATLVSLRMHLDNDIVHDIGVGCLLHDLGLRYITVQYDNVSLEHMTEKDLEEYRIHPIYGYTAIKNEDWLSEVSKEIVLCHHERLNGTGYPLHVTEISEETKIASLCDFFDESICGIGFERIKVHEVVEYIKTYKGILFDDNIVDVLLEFTAVYPSESKVITNEGETAIVIRQNKHFPERPVLRIVADKNGKIIDTIVVKDLLQYNNIFIEKVIN